ncbi:MAG: hypothetical protein FJ149_09160 [Euryarchaeota archaeon]|nr:hypothetical protein [Euryarchaeota archaeon]
MAISEAIAHVLRTRAFGISWDAIVPIPAGPGKPFTPAGMLARDLGALTRTAVAEVLELDSSYGSGQGLPEALKFDNMRDKVRIVKPSAVPGRRVLLHAGAVDVNVAVAGRSVDLRDLEFIGYAGR